MLPVTFGYSLSSESCRYETIEAVTKVIDTLTQEDFPGSFQKLFWTVTTSALQPEEITSKRLEFSCVYYQ